MTVESHSSTQIPSKNTHLPFTTPTRQRVPFADATNTNTARLAVETRSPCFSASPVSLTSLLNGKDDPHFPVPPQTDALPFGYGLDTLDDFLNTIANNEPELGSRSLATHRSLAGVDPGDCVLGTASPNSPSPPSQRLPTPDLDSEHSITPAALHATSGNAIKPTSWAAKNPTHPVAPTRVHHEVASRCFPVTEVSSAAVKKRLAREKQEVFTSDLTQSMEEHLDRLEEIASKHGKKFKDVLRIAGSAGRYKNHRAVSDLQAKILYQTKENNEGKPVGAKLRLEELQELAKTDPRCDELTEEEIQSLKEEIYAKRLDKQQGAWISHKSAANNYCHTADLIESALIGLGHRTGARGFAVLSRGSVDDVMPPSLLQISGSTAFLSTIVKVDLTDFVRQFEQFSCTVDHKAREDQSSIRKDITRLISEGLELTESILGREGNGEIVGKKRKEQSDKGGSHKPKKCKNKDDHARGQKRAKKGAKLPDISRSHSAEDSDDSDNSAENEDDIE
ncbi:uncharacterized protein ARMOST_13656 [Armillaria ostoyae]|uniref:Uncharacterized protein n=1 Tax=Armillaria ostoyae TaxID=47428 RepID=A0A284RNB8_ARMOS|nr:uncharacterized protein ARMOST_13656 [Armillaria ostoyae]